MAHGELHPEILVVMIGYLVVMIGLGSYLTRFIRRSSDLFVAKRNLHWLIAGASLLSIQVAGTTTIVVPGWGYFFGWGPGFAWNYAWATSVLIGAFTFWWVARKMGAHNASDILEYEYQSKFLRLYYAAIGVLGVGFFFVLAQLVGTATAVATLTGFANRETWILIMGLTIVFYAFTSGMWGVSLTDFAQFLVYLIAIYITLPIALLTTFGGWEFVVSTGPFALSRTAPELLQFPTGAFPLLSGYLGFGALGSFLGFWLLLALFPIGGTHYYFMQARCRNVGHVWKSGVFAAIMTFILLFPLALAGLYLRAAIGPPGPETIPPGAVGVVMGKVTGLFHPLLGSLIMAGIIAAAMSTADTVLVNGAVFFTRDIYRGWLRPGKSERHYIQVGRIVTLIIGIAAVLGGVFFPWGAAYALGIGGGILFVVAAMLIDALFIHTRAKYAAIITLIVNTIGALYGQFGVPVGRVGIDFFHPIWFAALMIPIYFVMAGIEYAIRRATGRLVTDKSLR